MASSTGDDGYVYEVRPEPPVFGQADPGFWSPEGQANLTASFVRRTGRRLGSRVGTALGLGVVMLLLAMLLLRGW